MNDSVFQAAARAHRSGNFAEAARLYGEVLRANPRHFPALFGLGYLYFQSGHFAEAERLTAEALRLNPASPEAYFTRGSALMRLDRAAEALACFDAALAHKPDFVEGQLSRATALTALGRFDAALESVDLVLMLNPKNASALNNRGRILQAIGRTDDAISAFTKAAAAEPRFTDALINRAALHASRKQFSEAAADAAKALAIDPELAYTRGHLCLYRLSVCDWRQWDQDTLAISSGLAAAKRGCDPFINLLISSSPAEQLQCARIWTAYEAPAAAAPLWRGGRYRHEKIRVAYVSGDLHSHAVAALIANVIETHDRQRFEIIAISFGPDDKSTMRARLVSAFDRFIDVRGRTDAEIAQIMRQMEIDIAVDLKGYTQDKRPRIFAFRPAPIQVNYLGYPGTMAAPYMDYLIADRVVIPEEQRSFYSERIAFLPDTYQCNDSKRVLTVEPPSRKDAGLPESGFVFCCFNNNFKITPPIFAIWMRLLHNVEGSVLWLLEDSAEAIANLKREAEAAGVDADRIIAAPRVNAAQYLARQRLADLFLDTQPYGAHTTASDALWMGLPVLTTLGPVFASRVAASLLSALNVPELITRSVQEYEQAALQYARAPDRLAAVKAKLAANRDTAPLFDTARYTRNLEAAFATMWERWQRGEPPADFVANTAPPRQPASVPQSAATAYMRACSLAQANQIEQALAEFDRAIEIAPHFVEALCNRGAILLALKRHAEALQSFDAALGINPSLFEGWNNRGNALSELGRFEEAIACYDRALTLRPQTFQVLLNRGNALIGAQRAADALTSYEQALAIEPNNAGALKGRANALFELSRFEEAIGGFEAVIAREPFHPYAFGDLAFSKLQCCDWRNLDEERARIVASVRNHAPVINPFEFLALSNSPEEQQACAGIWITEKFPPAAAPLWRGETYRHDKIRIAYASANFHNHAVGQALASVLERHDRTRFEITAISWGPDDKSALRGRLERACDRFVDVSRHTDADAARLMRQMEIDIAVDLMGFTADHRTAIFAARPAPVQVNYLGFAGTMAAPYMDYIVADDIVIPNPDRSRYSEKVIALPGSYLPIDDSRIAENSIDRAMAGLPDNAFVFACFNNSYKISPDVFAIWMNLLRQTNGSVLWLSRANAAAARNLAREAQARGVDPSRLIFAPLVASPSDHLARLACADLFLDTLPYNAHATAVDALLAGLPLITCKGRSFAGRVGASLLHAAGLPELVTDSLASYQALALELANNPRTLNDLKAKLAANRQTQPLFDTAHYTRQLEQAFVDMLERSGRRAIS